MKNNLNLLFMALFSLVTCQTSAQEASNGWVVENIHGPSQVGIVDSIPVDINTDGLMDVVSASIEDGHLRAYINQGDSTFTEQYISKDVPGIYRVTATDINNDGEIDFLYPSIETQQVVALIADENSQPLGYRKQIIAESILLPTDALPGDFNNDGLVDVVSISFESNTVNLHQQQLNGEFSTTVVAQFVLRPRKITIADYDNNNFLDILVVSEQDNAIRLLENSGGGFFNEMIISNEMIGARYIVSCDFNNDEFIDFMVSASAIDSIFVLINGGDGPFEIKPIDSEAYGTNALHCADINDDSQKELIGVAPITGSIHSYSLKGLIEKDLIANTRDVYVSINFADFGHGTGPQILTQAYFENRNLLYYPLAENMEKVVWEDFPDGATKVVQADINNDGIQDVVATSFRDNRVQWYDGNDQSHNIIAENIGGAADLVVGDFNQDGFIDVVSAASFDDRFYLHLNNQSNIFQTSVLFDDAKFANALAITDFDEDGWFDVIGSSGSDDRLRWFKFENDKVSTIDLGVTGDAPNDVEVGDVDGDGDKDLLVVNFFSGDVLLYLNDGEQNFTKEIISSGWNRPYASLISNKKSTGLSNLIVTMSANNQIIEFIQSSLLKFQEKILLVEVTNPRKLTYDAGHQNIFVSSPNDRKVVKFDGNSEVQNVVENFSGVSDINSTDIASQLITCSNVLNSVSIIIKDLIFKSSFND